MIFFVKLGGSLITDKTKFRSPRMPTIRSLAQDLMRAREADPSLKLILGHGSGSYGHVSGSRHQTRDGVSTQEDWLGFAEVWRDARRLNQIVINELCSLSLPVIAFPPSSAAVSRNRKVLAWDLYPMEQALANGLIPVVNGDVVFDTTLNGTILSTEDVFLHLMEQMPVDRVLLAGTEPGVWGDFPNHKDLIQTLLPEDLTKFTEVIGGSSAKDVTGGMAEKVRLMVALVEKIPNLKVSIFSGEEPGNLFYALLGGYPGTTIQQHA